MIDLTNAMNKTVPISVFNRGLASKVFKNVKQQGAMVVIKKNVAECVLVSPEEYVSLMDELNDMKLQLFAMQRMANADLSAAVPAEAVYRNQGIDPKDIENFEEVEVN